MLKGNDDGMMSIGHVRGSCWSQVSSARGNCARYLRLVEDGARCTAKFTEIHNFARAGIAGSRCLARSR